VDVEAILKSIDDHYEVNPIEESLRDSVVIVTGGTTGIGRGCVHGFMKMGAHVVFCGRNAERGDAVQKEMNERYPGQKCIFKQIDVSKEDEVEALVEYTAKTLGRINTLVNNAGYFPLQRPSDAISVEEFRDRKSVV
jgi:NAD(P)-dependent dehydrogenase (short-subunit alcohol dehydrogenase family)